jgi:hypothetical protein
MAAYKGQLEAVKSLLAAGADAAVKSSCVLYLPYSSNEYCIFSFESSVLLAVSLTLSLSLSLSLSFLTLPLQKKHDCIRDRCCCRPHEHFNVFTFCFGILIEPDYLHLNMSEGYRF